MKGFARHIVVAALVCAVMALTGCSALRKAARDRLSEIELTSFAVEKISPKGLKALDASFFVGINNPTVKLELKEVTVRLFCGDSELGNFVFDPFTVEGHRDGVYLLTGHASLASASALLQVLGALGGSGENLTVQITAAGKGLGVRRSLSRTMPLEELINMVKG